MPVPACELSLGATVQLQAPENGQTPTGRPPSLPRLSGARGSVRPGIGSRRQGQAGPGPGGATQIPAPLLTTSAMAAQTESWFAVLVDYEWIDQRGFQLWEASSPVDIDGTVGCIPSPRGLLQQFILFVVKVSMNIRSRLGNGTALKILSLMEALSLVTSAFYRGKTAAQKELVCLENHHR